MPCAPVRKIVLASSTTISGDCAPKGGPSVLRNSDHELSVSESAHTEAHAVDEISAIRRAGTDALALLKLDATSVDDSVDKSYPGLDEGLEFQSIRCR